VPGQITWLRPDAWMYQLPQGATAEPPPQVSRRLIRMREQIAAGGLTRRMSQGQPYWIYESSDAEP
jgi:hypothetical protein